MKLNPYHTHYWTFSVEPTGCTAGNVIILYFALCRPRIFFVWAYLMMEQSLDGCTFYFGCCPLIFIQNWWEQNYFPCSHLLDPSSFETVPFTSAPQLFFLCVKSAHRSVCYLFTHMVVTYRSRLLPKIRNMNIKIGRWNDRLLANWPGCYHQLFAMCLTLLVPRADISAFAPQAKSAASRYIGSGIDHN
jgi:hypothetical protein